MHLPVAVAASFPFAEVLGFDGSSFEVGVEDGFDFGEFVEVFGDGDGGLAGIEAAVDLVADGAREFGDFAVALVVGFEGDSVSRRTRRRRRDGGIGKC